MSLNNDSSASKQIAFETLFNSGQKAMIEHGSEVFLKRPNKLKVSRAGGVVAQGFNFDGAKFALHGKRVVFSVG